MGIYKRDSPTQPPRPVSPTKVVTNIPTSYQSMLWFAVGALDFLPVMMWVIDFAMEWYMDHVEKMMRKRSGRRERMRKMGGKRGS